MKLVVEVVPLIIHATDGSFLKLDMFSVISLNQLTLRW